MQNAVAGLEERLSVLNKNDNLANATVQNAVAGLEERLSSLINSTMNTNLEARLTNTLVKLLKPMQQQLDYHLPPPKNSEDHPGKSCKAVYEQNPRRAPSGYYWIAKSGSPAVRVYCEMNITCGDQAGGWMRVANIDMRNTSHTCPSGLHLISSPKRVCDFTGIDSCSSNTFDVREVQYSKVCGRIIGYHRSTLIAFYRYRFPIEESYVHGVSLTHVNTFGHLQEHQMKLGNEVILNVPV